MNYKYHCVLRTVLGKTDYLFKFNEGRGSPFKYSSRFPKGRRANPVMTTSRCTTRRKGDPQHMLRKSRCGGNGKNVQD